MSHGTSTTIRDTTDTSTRTTTPRRSSSHYRSSHDRAGILLIAAAVLWSLAAFGGAYAWTLPPLLVIAAAAIVLVRPSPCRQQRALDGSLVAAFAAAAVQLIPVSPGWRGALSPHQAAVQTALRFDAAARLARWQPLSIDAEATAAALAAAAAAIAVFWTARTGSSRGNGARTLSRAIAWTGLAVGALVIVQHYSSPTLIYWRFRPVDAGGAIAGPFVNRNHMATWLLLALPTSVGYIVARTNARSGGRTGVAAFLRTVEEPTTVWLLAATAGMLAALITAQSRSAVIGLIAGGVAALLIGRTAGTRVSGGWVLALVAGVVAIAAGVASTGTLLARFDPSAMVKVGGRTEIWRQTLPIVHDFALTGTGIGTYGTAMFVYQQGERLFMFNQAHNQYLHLAAEGGLLVCVPAAAVIATFAHAAWRQVRDDRSPLVWLRIGALAATVAVAVQSIWETGLRMPANAVLFAVVCAVAVYPAADRS